MRLQCPKCHIVRRTTAEDLSTQSVVGKLKQWEAGCDPESRLQDDSIYSNIHELNAENKNLRQVQKEEH